MAKKPVSNRFDPKQNRSLAIRNVLKEMPAAEVKEIVESVKKQYGHRVKADMVYMVKTKLNMASDGRPKRTRSAKKSSLKDNPMTSAALWVEAIKIGRQLLKATGSVANSIALLKALDG